MKLTKLQIKEIIKEVLEEEGEVEEGLSGAALGAFLAKRNQGPGYPNLGVEDLLKMGAGGYFGHKIQQSIQNKKKDANEKTT